MYITVIAIVGGSRSKALNLKYKGYGFDSQYCRPNIFFLYFFFAKKRRQNLSCSEETLIFSD